MATWRIWHAAAAARQQTVPVWSIAPQSVIVTPAPGAELAIGRRTEIAGWAWADGGVGALDVVAEAWQPAVLEAPTGRAWQRFTLAWTPARHGPATLASRAIGVNGDRQPESGRRNAIYRVPVTVR